jgi:uncharacterized protein YkwD
MWRRRVGLALAATALIGCWDSVATPIRIAVDGGSEAGAGGTDGAVRDRDAGPPGGALDTRHCEPVNEWPEESARAEFALFMAINGLRESEWPRCNGREYGGRRAPLRHAPELRCAARLHSMDMVNRDFVGSINPSGESPWQRVAETGFRYDWIEESIVTGGNEYGQAFENLRSSREDCDRILDPGATAVGIGLHSERWTLDFGDR